MFNGNLGNLQLNVGPASFGTPFLKGFTMSNRKKITLFNNFHGSQVTVNAVKTDSDYHFYLSKGQMKRAVGVLCGMGACGCGGFRCDGVVVTELPDGDGEIFLSRQEYNDRMAEEHDRIRTRRTCRECDTLLSIEERRSSVSDGETCFNCVFYPTPQK